MDEGVIDLAFHLALRHCILEASMRIGTDERSDVMPNIHSQPSVVEEITTTY